MDSQRRQQTGSSGGGGAGLENLPREALKNLRAQGINLPGGGGMDVDASEEEDYLLDGSDKAWATSSDISGDDDDDEDDDDDDDDDEILFKELVRT